MMWVFSKDKRSLKDVTEMEAKSQHIALAHDFLKKRQGISGVFQVRGAMQVVIEALQVELKSDA